MLATATFEKSAAFDYHAHVPIYNMANSALVKGDVASAHQLYERALLAEPRLAEAHFNDGHALYAWGAREIDPSGCELDRTRALWEQAAARFARAAELAEPDTPLGRAAATNHRAILAALEGLDELAEQCAGGGGGGDEGSTGGGGQSGADTGEGPEETGNGGAPPTAGEQQELAEALERIRREAAEAGSYRQSRHGQLDPESAGEAEGKKIWW